MTIEQSMFSKAMRVKCPKCGKPPGDPCYKEGFNPLVHWERVDASEAPSTEGE